MDAERRKKLRALFEDGAIWPSGEVHLRVHEAVDLLDAADERDRLAAKLAEAEARRTAAAECVERHVEAHDVEVAGLMGQLAEVNAEAAVMRQALEAGAAVLRSVVGTHAGHWTTCPSYPRTVVAGTLQGACDCGLAAALATDAGKRLLDVVRGLPAWLTAFAHVDHDAWRAAGFPDAGAMARGAFAAKLRLALSEHLRAAGIETGGSDA